MFAEGAAKIAAASIIAEFEGKEKTFGYAGDGSCYIEFGNHLVGRVDVDFFSGPSPTGKYIEASTMLVTEKEHFGSSRRTRWFGL